MDIPAPVRHNTEFLFFNQFCIVAAASIMVWFENEDEVADGSGGRSSGRILSRDEWMKEYLLRVENTREENAE